MMWPLLLSILACPKCGGRFRLERETSCHGSICEGELRCSSCNVAYPVREGVPRFVGTDSYADTFSLEWTNHVCTQLDSFNCWDKSEKEFCGHWPFDCRELSGKLVLDAGCGVGRFAEIALKYGAQVVGLDMSRSIDVANTNFGSHDRFQCLQADLLSLPFGPATFDYIYSFGVLHHTPDPSEAFAKLASLLKPGGGIAINVYAAYNKVHLALTRIYRRAARRLGIRSFWYLSHVIGLLHYPCRLRVFNTPLTTFAPIHTGPTYRWTQLDTFDWYTPKYMSFHTHPEVDLWFENAGLSQRRVTQGQVAMFGRKSIEA